MREFVSVKLRCPVCGMEFSADEVHGAVPVARETDFRPVFHGSDPVLSHMHSCPRCRYSAYREGFETEKSDEDELVEPIDDDPKSLPRPYVTIPDERDADDLRRYARSGELADGIVAPGQDPFGARRYALAARVHEFIHEEEPLVAAHYYLRAAWSARAGGDRNYERASLREALLRLSNVLEKRQGLTQSDQLRVLYLAGEVARRAGDFGRAIEYFAEVESDADPDDAESSQLAYLARRQSQFAVVKSDVNALLPTEWPGRKRSGDDGDDDPDEEVFDDDDDTSLN